jgi:hypothetical protein
MTPDSLIFKYTLATKLLREIASEWANAEDVSQFQEEHVETYGSKISFDDLIREVESISFK